ncbi:MAG: outer membrane beta-barrel protein, partial [Flavisolibacter sp.]
MRNILLTLLVISFIPSFGQEKQKFQLSFQLQPELTLHQNQYSYRWRDKYPKATFNVGIASELQYNVTNRWFLNLGLGYLSRRINTTVFLDQGKLPPPHYSETKELNTIKYLSYRMLQFPINLNYSFAENKKVKAFVVVGISANYLLNAYYKVGSAQYDGTYTKGYWQGVAVNGGIGADFHLTKNILLTNTISYSF